MFLSHCSDRTIEEKFASHKCIQYQQADDGGSHGGVNSVASSRPLPTVQYAGPKIEASKTSCDAHLPFENPTIRQKCIIKKYISKKLHLVSTSFRSMSVKFFCHSASVG
jgi:hypothetical protein